ncbi:MAG: class I SAM-dependent RNA methyltransferase [Lachnospiraceae bacterium]|nr:class I SAM-dependent RNA methyltransferase [Lachnospiraceae bacterium]
MAKMEMTIAVPCHFGLEAVLKREISDLGYDILSTEDGRVSFHGDLRAAAEANVHLRTAERVLLECARFRAVTFDELFEAVKAVPWEQFIPKNGKFWVRKVSSVRSALFSPSDIQSIVKKAMVDRLSSVYGISWFAEDGPSYPFRVAIRKDMVSVCLDTSGESLHKRGYRKEQVMAPISETLAAALILLTPWRRGRILADPCCGSGTIPIEAAMIARGIAPGMNRHFQMEEWKNLDAAKYVLEAQEEAKEAVLPETESDLQGFDIDPYAIRCARENAKNAGVEGQIHFQARALKDFSHPKKYGFLISNPPYGERLQNEKELPELYRTFGEVYARLDDWSMYLISSYEDTEKYIGKKADKNRKIYNGMLQTRYFQYLGPKPPKRNREAAGSPEKENR